jgi:hypothetical protein
MSKGTRATILVAVFLWQLPDLIYQLTCTVSLMRPRVVEYTPMRGTGL